MIPIVGVFNSRQAAVEASSELRSAGFGKKAIDLLSPDARNTAGTAVRSTGTQVQPTGTVPVDDTERPGIGKALGGVVGGSIGVAAGAELGAVAASLLFPGAGPVLATGIIGAALLGFGGVVGGAKLGEALDESMTEGLPVD